MAYEAIKPKGGDTGSPLSLQKRLAYFSKHDIVLDKQKVIDCGCGAGQYVTEFLALGADAYGVEYDVKKVASFQEQHPAIAFRVEQGDIESMNFADASFDVALLNEVLEHVPNERKGLEEIFRLLKAGGKLVIFSPNRYYPFESHGVYRKKSTKKVPIYVPFIPWIPLRLGHQLFDYWARNYWPHELQSLVRSAGFQIVHTDFFWQTFENISGQQPLAISILRKPMRLLATSLEKSPLKLFGVSQVILAQKPA